MDLARGMPRSGVLGAAAADRRQSSPVQFQHGDLPGSFHSILLTSGLEPSRLQLEITRAC